MEVNKGMRVAGEHLRMSGLFLNKQFSGEVNC